MTIRLRQSIAWFLMLAFAGAGLVGVSPYLHVLLEHGGHGPLHAHRGVVWSGESREASSESHPDAAWHPSPAPSGGVFVSVHREFELPLTRLWNRFRPRSAPAAPLPSPDPSAPGGHGHHSLAFTLATGGLETALGWNLFRPLPLETPYALPETGSRLSSPLLDPQTAGRAPPTSLRSRS